MTTQKHMQLRKETLERFGKNHQLLLALEELSELQKEILKNINRGADNLDLIIDETADAMIMLEQVQYVYDIKQAVEKRIEEKFDRLDERLEYYRKKEVEDGTVGN